MHRKTDWSENRKDDKGEMSFSGMVKEELSRQIGLARHCKMAELAAILCSCGKMECFSGDSKLKIQTENEAVARKCFTLLQKTFNIETKIFVRENSHLKRVKVYTIEITDPEEIQVIFQALRLVTNSIDQGTLVLSDMLVVQQNCCKRAFIRGAFLASGSISDPEKGYHFEIRFPDNPDLKRVKVYTIEITDPEEIQVIFQALRLVTNSIDQGTLVLSDMLVVQQNCCKRAFIRGAFLASGSISDPEKGYHFEIVCSDAKRAEQLQTIIRSFSVDAKIVQRKKSHVVYVKEGAQIVDMLAVMEANVALMDLENIRILKEMRNSVNRKVNCETANINKTVNAAVKQMEDIKLVRQKIGFEQLNEGLAQVAELRMQYPEATLKELGMMLSPQVGKSGVNHRLRKLSAMADELREKQGGELL